MFRTIRARIIIPFLIALAVVVSAAVAFGYQVAHEQERRAIDAMGMAAAGSCAAVYEIFAAGGNEPVPGTSEYDECRRMLRSLCETCGMSYLYVCRYDTEAQTATYLMSAAADDGQDDMFGRERPYGTVVRDGISDVELSALSGQATNKAHEFDNELGSMLDWYSLVDNSDGSILGAASYSISDQRDRVFRSTVCVVMPFALALIALLVVELMVLRRRVFNPIRAIAERMRGFSAEHAGAVEPLAIDSRDEMADISRAFEGMAANIAEYARDVERMTVERVQADVELGVARRIQLGMVPERTDLRGADFELSAFARPAREVGGDFYDAFELDGARVALVVGDVSGKGVAAALFMAMAKTVIRDEMLASEDPLLALGCANARLCSSNPEGMFATAFAAVLDLVTGQVRYANAGHVPPLVVGGRVCKLDVAPGDLLGLFEDAAPASGSIALETGEWLLACTDGAEESVSAEGAFLGEAGLVDCLASAAPYAHARDLVDAVVSAVDAFADGREQFDDLTVVAIGRMRAGGCEGILPVEIDSFATVRAEILALSADDAAGRKACLACEEAFANIVAHSAASCIWYKVSAVDGVLRVALEDDGAPFDSLAVAPERRAFDDLAEGGMGIGLIRSLATEVAYRREASRNILDLRFE